MTNSIEPQDFLAWLAGQAAGDVVRDAFGQVVQQVAADTEMDVWHGTP